MATSVISQIWHGVGTTKGVAMTSRHCPDCAGAKKGSPRQPPLCSCILDSFWDCMQLRFGQFSFVAWVTSVATKDHFLLLSTCTFLSGDKKSWLFVNALVINAFYSNHVFIRMCMRTANFLFYGKRGLIYLRLWTCEKLNFLSRSWSLKHKLKPYICMFITKVCW